MSEPTETLAKALQWDMGSWQSLEVRISEKYRNENPARVASEPRSFNGALRYIETATGQRLYEERITPDGEGKTLVSINYTDGEKTSFLFRTDQGSTTGDEQVTMKRSFGHEDQEGISHRPDPLRVLYVGLEPLPKALSKGRHLGKGRQLDRDCERYLFDKIAGRPGTLSLVYWLDRSSGFPLRVDYFEDEKAFAKGLPASIWSARSLDVVDGHHIALQSELVKFRTQSDKPDRPAYTYDIQITEAKFNETYPISLFRPAITDKTTVVDMVKNKIVWPKSASTSQTPSSPIRLSEPSGWFSLSLSAAGLGICVVATAMVLRWRQRGK